ncbi:type III secretion protein [Erwinia tracheiphila]
MVISLLLNHWQILSAAAHFAGGYLMRDQLMKHAATLATDSRLLSFISLPILYQANIENEFSDTHFTTIENGAAFIMSIASTLPRALQQRLALCFAHNMNKPPCVANPTPDNLNLLKMSIIYASN